MLMVLAWGVAGQNSGPAAAAVGEAASGRQELSALSPKGSPGQPQFSRERLCQLVEAAAQHHSLPTHFFSRVLWQESSFRTDAVSPVGAKGIAQFMPLTAAERGLANPLDPHQAIPASADFLSDLVQRFGNLGLAAAAYNGGPGRLRLWLAGSGELPLETRDYVVKVTGRPVEHWRDLIHHSSRNDSGQETNAMGCVEVVTALASAGARSGLDTRRALLPADSSPEALMALPAGRPERGEFVEPLAKAKAAAGQVAAAAPAQTAEPITKRTAAPGTTTLAWGVQLAANASEAKALASYHDLQKRHPDILSGKKPVILRKHNASMGTKPVVNVRVAAETREAADELCRKLQDQGGACAVFKN